jgi:uncharacterized protein YqgC (DUF456 family)
MGLRAIAGWFLLAVGVLGCLLPIMPGIPLLVAGAALLGSEHWLVRKLQSWLRSKGVLR